MFRQSPSRNQRSKGIKFKHGLQICLLLAVCFWLIYQVKHSHDKKKEFDENDAKRTLNTDSGNEVLRLGRKDLHPRVDETATKNEKHEEDIEEEETAVEEEEEKKHEEEDIKTEEKEDEGRGGGDDEIDERDQEKSDVEVDREEDFIDEDKEREEVNEKESEDKDGHTENESSLEDHDRDGGTRNTHEAREEHYKADDASSAVTHDTVTISTENENEGSENSDKHAEMNTLELENEANNTEKINVGQNMTELKVEDGETAENGNPSNATAIEGKGSGIVSSKSEDSSFSNSTVVKESNDQLEESNNSKSIDQPGESNNLTEVNTESHGLSPQNGTETISDLTRAQNSTIEGSHLQMIFEEQADNSIPASDNRKSDSNSTISSSEFVEAIPGESSNSSANPEFAEAEDRSTSEVNTDATQSEMSDANNGIDESSGSSKTENAEHELIDSSVALEEKEVHIDLDTLPEIRTEGSNSEDAAAE